MSDRDWRLPENRREAFLRFYGFHLRHRIHPGCVYFALPALAEHYALDEEGLAWLVWLNGNTQNPVTTQLLLDASKGSPRRWRDAVVFWERFYSRLQWDTDRRYQKARFGDATERWIAGGFPDFQGSWAEVWKSARALPFMGRLSAWSMIEYARILLPGVPDAESLLLRDPGSRSHRNGLAIVAGWGDPYAEWDRYDIEFFVPELEELGEELLDEARARFPEEPDVSRLTLESALCTYKSWHKPNRRYPGVYADMHAERIETAERNGWAVDLQWKIREANLPDYLRTETNPRDPGVSPEKQNLYRETGVPPMMHREYPDMDNPLNRKIEGR